MGYTLQLKPDTSAETAHEALARATADEVALVFPLGARCALSNSADLEALYIQCQALGKRVIIIGGDELLRAHAVAAGFAAATSVAEWETSKHKAVRPGQKLLGLRRRVTGALTGAPAPQAAPLRVVPPGSEPAAGNTHLYDLEGEDPPEYVVTLVSADQTLIASRRADTVPTIPLQRSRTTRRLAETLRDRAEAEALERAHYAYEERVTETIRTSGGAVTPDVADVADVADAGADDQAREADS